MKSCASSIKKHRSIWRERLAAITHRPFLDYLWRVYHGQASDLSTQYSIPVDFASVLGGTSTWNRPSNGCSGHAPNIFRQELVLISNVSVKRDALDLGDFRLSCP